MQDGHSACGAGERASSRSHAGGKPNGADAVLVGRSLGRHGNFVRFVVVYGPERMTTSYAATCAGSIMLSCQASQAPSRRSKAWKSACGLRTMKLSLLRCAGSAPLASYAIDRRTLRSYAASFICFSCARRFPHVYSWERSTIRWVPEMCHSLKESRGAARVPACEVRFCGFRECGNQHFRPQHVFTQVRPPRFGACRRGVC